MSDALAEAIAAGVGGAFSSSTLYPIEICKNRLQATKKQQSPEESGAAQAVQKPPTNISQVAVQLYEREGFLAFYKGFQYSAMQSATEKSIYFYGYTWIVQAWKSIVGEMSPAGSVVCGCLAEWVHLPISLPIDAVTVRIQTGEGKQNPISILRSIVRESGIKGLYSGWTAYIVLCLKPAITYALFDALKKVVLKRRAKASGKKADTLTALEAFLIGAIARAIATITVFPYTRAKVIVKSTKVQPGEQPPTIAGTVAQIIKNEGFLALYQGCTPEVSRGVLSAALMLSCKEKISAAVKKAIKQRNFQARPPPPIGVRSSAA